MAFLLIKKIMYGDCSREHGNTEPSRDMPSYLS